MTFQVSELQYPAYHSDYKHGCQGTISQNGQTRRITSDFWLYVRSDTLYRKTRNSTLFTKYTLLSCCDVTDNQLLCVCGRPLVTRSRFISANRFFTFYINIYAFSRCFYPKRLTNAFRLYIFISMCVPWELNPQHFALLTQCSTTEPHRNTVFRYTSLF